MRLLEQVENLKQERRDLEAERQKVIEESTAAKLEKIDERSREIQNSLHDLHRQCSSAKSASQPGQREKELMAAIKETQQREQAYRAEVRLISSRYICADPAADFQAGIDAKENKLAEVLEPFKKAKHVDPFKNPRIRALREEIENLKRELDNDAKLFEVGKKIFGLREERKGLTAEREQLREEREATVLEKAKVA